MAYEPRELTEARELLGKFEAEMSRPKGLVHLSEALPLLADVCAAAESERTTQVASNIALAYVRKVQTEVEHLMRQESPPHWEIVCHWQKVFAEFERSGFALPAETAEALSKLLMKKWRKDISLMSASERQELLEKLQAMGSK